MDTFVDHSFVHVKRRERGPRCNPLWGDGERGRVVVVVTLQWPGSHLARKLGRRSGWAVARNCSSFPQQVILQMYKFWRLRAAARGLGRERRERENFRQASLLSRRAAGAARKVGSPLVRPTESRGHSMPFSGPSLRRAWGPWSYSSVALSAVSYKQPGSSKSQNAAPMFDNYVRTAYYHCHRSEIQPSAASQVP